MFLRHRCVNLFLGVWCLALVSGRRWPHGLNWEALLFSEVLGGQVLAPCKLFGRVPLWYGLDQGFCLLGAYYQLNFVTSSRSVQIFSFFLTHAYKTGCF